MKQNNKEKYLGKWWIPFIFWAITFVLYNVSELFKISFLRGFSLTLLISSLVLLLISSIYQFYKKKWLGGFISLATALGTIAFFIIIALGSFLITMIGGDQWADNLKIPENIPLSKPIDTDQNGNRTDSILKIERKKTDFLLYKSFQPGLYEYDFWTTKIEKGKVYLKAYEITQNYRLSETALSENTSIEIYNPSNTIMKFGTKARFTIYEGDWGKPYAARFEVWFKPNNNEQERKLFERNYIIEDWMH
jgi:hypothetical protein